LSIPKMIHMSIWSSGGMMLTGETEELWEKPVPVPLCPPQTPHGLPWVRTRTSVVKIKWQFIHADCHKSDNFFELYTLCILSPYKIERPYMNGASALHLTRSHPLLNQGQTDRHIHLFAKFLLNPNKGRKTLERCIPLKANWLVVEARLNNI
jgi:hypothetical protein